LLIVFGAADLVPHDWGIIVSAILPVLIFNWVGFELQNGAGEEMENPQRDVPRSVIRAGLTAVLAYGLIIAVILFALTKDQLSQATGFLSAFKVVSSVLPAPVAAGLGLIVALGVVIALASSGGTWIIGADRTYAIAALDRTAPKLLGRFSGRYGTPIAVNTMSGIVATLAMFAAIIVNAFGTGSIAVLFQLVLGFVISTTTLSYLFIFPSYLILRYKYPDIRRPYKVPGGMVGAWIVTLFPLAYAAIASYFILWPTDSNVSSVGRLTYELTQFIPLGVIALLTIVFYIWGQNQANNRDVAVELNLADMNESELRAGAGE
jgi:glutamate:GABA antiporter